MKAKVSEQDLTDYALDELEPQERIYVETALVGSEEAREDVYAMIDMAMMLDEGFERQQSRAPAVLTVEQRRALMNVRQPNIFLRNTVVALAAAACVAFALARLDAWLPQWHRAPQAGVASTAPGQTGMQASAAAQEPDFVKQIMQFRDFADDPLLRKWFKSLTLPGGTGSSPGINTDSMPLDLMP